MFAPARRAKPRKETAMPLTRRAFFPTGWFGDTAGADVVTAPAEDGYLADICSTKPGKPAAPGVDPLDYARFTAGMRTGMDKMMLDMDEDPPSGDPDLDFLVMMIPHHWGATEMARLVLLHGRDPLVREIAEKILATQVSEIEGMRARPAALCEGMDSYPSLPGTGG